MPITTNPSLVSTDSAFAELEQAFSGMLVRPLVSSFSYPLYSAFLSHVLPGLLISGIHTMLQAAMPFYVRSCHARLSFPVQFCKIETCKRTGRFLIGSRCDSMLLVFNQHLRKTSAPRDVNFIRLLQHRNGFPPIYSGPTRAQQGVALTNSNKSTIMQAAVLHICPRNLNFHRMIRGI
jgi:hypothetical protein